MNNLTEIIVGGIVVIGVGIYFSYDFFYPKPIYIENRLKICDTPIDYHIIAQALPRNERINVNDAILSSIDLCEMTILSSGTFALFIPLLVIWGFDYFKFKQTILPIKPSSRTGITEEIEYRRLIHSKKHPLPIAMENRNRDYLLGIRRAPIIDEPLEHLRGLNWTIENFIDPDLPTLHMLKENPITPPSWDKISYKIEFNSDSDFRLENAVLIAEKYVPTSHFEWFVDNIDFSTLNDDEILSYAKLLPDYRQVPYIKAVQQYYEMEKIKLKQALALHIVQNIIVKNPTTIY